MLDDRDEWSPDYRVRCIVKECGWSGHISLAHIKSGVPLTYTCPKCEEAKHNHALAQARLQAQCSLYMDTLVPERPERFDNIRSWRHIMSGY